MGSMSPDDLHKILEPLLAATALAILCFAVAVVFLWRDGRRQKQESDGSQGGHP